MVLIVQYRRAHAFKKGVVALEEGAVWENTRGCAFGKVVVAVEKNNVFVNKTRRKDESVKCGVKRSANCAFVE